jgi:DNA-binding transcriptional MocR family regulator
VALVRIDPDTLRLRVTNRLSGRGPLYRQLAGAIEASIDAGDLPPDVCLPSERALANALPASRGTVVAAYDLLASRGVVRRDRGRGTLVRSSASDAARMRELRAGLRARRLADGVVGAAEPDASLIDLSLAVLEDPTDLPPEAFAVDLDDLAKAGRGHGYLALGIDDLRAAAADVVSDSGLPATSHEIAITNGAHQGIGLAADLLVSPGDLVVVEEPCHPGAIDLFARLGARIATVPTDGAGPVPAALERVLRREAPALVYLVSACSNPAGVVTSAARGAEIAALVRRHDTWLLEDRAFQHLCFETPPPPIGAACPERSVVAFSTSKVFWGGLRVGWVRAPGHLVDRIGRLRASRDLATAIGPQIVALRLLDHLDAIAARRRLMVGERLEILADALAHEAPDIPIRRPAGGMSLWLRLPVGDGDGLADMAASCGLGILPGSATSPGERHLDHVRIAVAAPPPVLVEAAARFGEAWRRYAAEAESAGSTATVSPMRPVRRRPVAPQ